MLLPHAEGGGDFDGVPLLAVLHQSCDVHGRTDVRIDGAAHQLERVAVHRVEFDLSGLLVERLVHAWMQDHLSQTHLSGHAVGHLALALQQDGLNVVENQLALRRV